MWRLKKMFQIIYFVLINIIYSICLKNIGEINIDNKIIISGTVRKKLKDVYAIYSYFNNKNRLAIEKRIIYFFFSRKYVISAQDSTTHEIIGIEFYYRNKRDVYEKTIHQGFRGVLPEYQGKKIGTMITVHAISHFKSNHLDGISSRVSLNNLPSLKSNINLGFKPLEKYFDKDMNEERYYLICPLNENR